MHVMACSRILLIVGLGPLCDEAYYQPTPSALPTPQDALTNAVPCAVNSCPAMLGLQAKPENALAELNEVVPQLPVQFFLTDQGILPPLNASSAISIKKTIGRLKQRGDLVRDSESGNSNHPSWRWAAFPQIPSASGNEESGVLCGGMLCTSSHTINPSQKSHEKAISLSPNRSNLPTALQAGTNSSRLSLLSIASGCWLYCTCTCSGRLSCRGCCSLCASPSHRGSSPRLCS